MNDSMIFDKDVIQKLFRYACTLCINQDDAYDLLQYALEKFLRNQSDTKQITDVVYVRTIIRNRFIDEYRRLKRFPEESYDDESTVAIDVSSLEDNVLAQIELESVWEIFDPFEREILYYWAIEEMTAQEISDQINVPRGTILSRIYRLRRKIEATKDESKDLSGGSRV
ncbi:MAG: sigma-70 family RNA polymerase sigma factor [Bacteroidota bacterium]